MPRNGDQTTLRDLISEVMQEPGDPRERTGTTTLRDLIAGVMQKPGGPVVDLAPPRRDSPGVSIVDALSVPGTGGLGPRRAAAAPEIPKPPPATGTPGSAKTGVLPVGMPGIDDRTGEQLPDEMGGYGGWTVHPVTQNRVRRGTPEYDDAMNYRRMVNEANPRPPEPYGEPQTPGQLAKLVVEGVQQPGNIIRGIQAEGQRYVGGASTVAGTLAELAGADKNAAMLRHVGSDLGRDAQAHTGTAGGQLGSLVGNSIPAGIAMLATKGRVGPLASRAVGGAALGGMGVASAGGGIERYRAETIARGGTPDAKKELAIGAGHATAEILFERFGIARTGRVLGHAAEELADALLRKDVGSAARFFMRIGEAGAVNFGEEAATQVAQNLVDKYGYDPEREATEGLTEAGLKGALQGLLFGGVSGAATGAAIAADRIKMGLDVRDAQAERQRRSEARGFQQAGRDISNQASPNRVYPTQSPTAPSNSTPRWAKPTPPTDTEQAPSIFPSVNARRAGDAGSTPPWVKTAEERARDEAASAPPAPQMVPVPASAAQMPQDASGAQTAQTPPSALGEQPGPPQPGADMTTRSGPIPPNTMVLDVRDREGNPLAILSEPHDGSMNGIESANARLRERAYADFEDASGVSTRGLAADGGGNIYAVSPNGRSIAHRDSPDAAYILGNLDFAPSQSREGEQPGPSQPASVPSIAGPAEPAAAQEPGQPHRPGAATGATQPGATSAQTQEGQEEEGLLSGPRQSLSPPPPGAAQAPPAGSKAQTPGAQTEFMAVSPESFTIKTREGASINGRVRDADFPDQASRPDRGEIFFLQVPESGRRQGTGASLVRDAMRLIAANGGRTVKLTVPSKMGAPLIAKMQRDGTIGRTIQVSERTGTMEVENPFFRAPKRASKPPAASKEPGQVTKEDKATPTATGSSRPIREVPPDAGVIGVRGKDSTKPAAKPKTLKQIVAKSKTAKAPPAKAAEQGPTADKQPSVADLHALADSKGLAWDDDPAFMDLTERATGKRHLDDLTGPERAKVAAAIEATEPGPKTLKAIVAESKKPEPDDQRERALAEADEAFGPTQTRAFAPIIDAFSRFWARATGRDAEGFWSKLTFVKGGTPGGGAQMQTATPTDSLAFKAWFGQSKIVDAKGKPLLVYHGTNQGGFEVFNPTRPRQVVRVDGEEARVLNYYDHDYNAKTDWRKVDPKAYHFGALADLTVFKTAEEAIKFREREGMGSKPDEHSGDARHLADLRRLVGKKVDRSNEARPTGDASYFATNTGYNFIHSSESVYPVYLSIKNPIRVNASEIEGAGWSKRVEKYKAQGYDGAIFSDDPKDITKAGWSGHAQIVAFYPKQVKGAFNRGTFDPDNPNILYQEQMRAATFYSAAQRAVEGFKDPRARMTGTQWAKWLQAQPGIKPEELEWLGLGDVPDKMTREEAANWIAQNGVQVTEKIRGGTARYDNSEDGLIKLADDMANSHALLEEVLGPKATQKVSSKFEDLDAGDMAEYLIDEYSDDLTHFLTNGQYETSQGGLADAAKFAEHQTPGADPDSYRELLLTLPTPQNKANLDAAARHLYHKPFDEITPDQQAQVRRDIHEDPRGTLGAHTTFTAGHFDEPNVLAHVRFNDRSIPTYTGEQFEAIGRKIHDSIRSRIATKVEKAIKKIEQEPAFKKQTKGWKVQTESEDKFLGQRSIRLYDAEGRLMSMRSGFRGSDRQAIAEAWATGGSPSLAKRLEEATRDLINHGYARYNADKINSEHVDAAAEDYSITPAEAAIYRHGNRLRGDTAGAAHKTLFIEEIQSDWGQKVRKAPPVSAQERESIKARVAELRARQQAADKRYEAIHDEMLADKTTAQNETLTSEPGVVDAGYATAKKKAVDGGATPEQFTKAWGAYRNWHGSHDHLDGGEFPWHDFGSIAPVLRDAVKPEADRRSTVTLMTLVMNEPAREMASALDRHGSPELKEMWSEKVKALASAYEEAKAAGDAIAQAEAPLKRTTPTAPFVTSTASWTSLALKRMLRYAADNGYDRIAWTTGEMQAERYDLSKQVDNIQVGLDDGRYWFNANRGGRALVHKDGLRADELESHIGKDLAKRAVDDLAKPGLDAFEVAYSGVDLKVGGEGMKGFYDKILPAEANRLVKKWGGRVAMAEIDAGQVTDSQKVQQLRDLAAVADKITKDAFILDYKEITGRDLVFSQYESLVAKLKAGHGETAVDEFVSREKKAGMKRSGTAVHSLDITPAMREEILKGLPLFQRTGDNAQGSYELTQTGQRVIRALTDPNASTLPHEMAHAFLDFLAEIAPDLHNQAVAALGGKSGEPATTAIHEGFARGFERYLRDGEAPSPALKTAFERFREWLLDIYRTIIGTPLENKVNPKLKAVFKTMLTAGDEQPAQTRVFIDGRVRRANATVAKKEAALKAAKQAGRDAKKERAELRIARKAQEQALKDHTAAWTAEAASQPRTPRAPKPSTTAQAPAPEAPEPARTPAKPKANRPFGRADLQDRIMNAQGQSPAFRARMDQEYVEANRDLETGKDIEAGRTHGGGIGREFSYHGKMPGELAALLDGRPDLRRALRKVERAGDAGWEDHYANVGPDRYLQQLEEAAGNGLDAALQDLRASHDPAHQFLAALHDNQPEGRLPGHEVLSPVELPEGAAFTINGTPFTVKTDPHGDLVLEGEGYPTTPVFALDDIPADRGSLKGGARKPRAAKAATGDVPDFAADIAADAAGQPAKATPRPTKTERAIALADRLEAEARARMEARRLPPGKPGQRTGGSTLAGDIADAAQIVVARMIRAGAKSLAGLRNIVNVVIDELAPHLKPHADKVEAAARATLEGNITIKGPDIVAIEAAARASQKPAPATPTAQAPAAEPATSPPAGEPDYATSSARNAHVWEFSRFWDDTGIPYSPARATFQEWLEQVLADGSAAGAAALAADVTADPRSLTTRETAVFVVRMQQIKNAHQAGRDALDALIRAGDTTGAELKANEIRRLQSEYDQIRTANELAGTKMGQQLAARKLTIDKSYDLVTVLSDARIAKGGKDLTAKEIKALEEAVARLEKLNAELEATSEEALARAEFEAAHQRMLHEAEVKKLKDMVGKGRRETPKPTARRLGEQALTKLHSAADAARARIKARGVRLYSTPIPNPAELADHIIVGADYIARGAAKFAEWSIKMIGEFGDAIRPHLPAIYKASVDEYNAAAKEKAEKPEPTTIEKIAARASGGSEADTLGDYFHRLALEIVRAGTTKREAVLDALHAQVKAVFPEITRTQARDILSGYGNYRRLDMEAAKARLREIKGESQKLAQLEALRRNEAPRATGSERQPPSDEARQLQKEVNRAKKSAGLRPTGGPGRLKTALEAAKTRIRNQIADLQIEIDTGTRIVRGRNVPLSDSELESLKTALASLREAHAAAFDGPGADDARRLKLATRAAERSANEWERRLAAAKGGSFAASTQTRSLFGPELEAARARARAAREHYLELKSLDPDQRAAAEDKSNAEYRARLAEEMADLTERIANQDFGPAAKPPPKAYPADIEKTRAEVAALRAKIHAARGNAAREARLRERIDLLEHHLNAGTVPPPKEARRTAPVPPHVAALQETAARLRREMAQSDPARVVRLRASLDRLNERLANITEARTPKPVKHTKATERLLYEIHEAKKGIRRKQNALRPKTFWGTTGLLIGEPLNLARSLLQTGLDLSAVAYQGAFVGMGDPKIAIKPFIAMFKSLGSDRAFFKVQQGLIARPNYPLFVRSKGVITETDGPLSKMEESVMSRTFSRVPILAAFPRAFTAYLNTLRMDLFDALVDTLAHEDGPTAVEARAFANFANIGTGRGAFGPVEQARPLLAHVFFAAGLNWSAVQIAAGQPMWGGTRRTRKAIAARYARFLVGLSVLYLVNWLAGGDDDEPVETDPRSTNFGTIKIGQTRMSPLGPFRKPIVLFSRLISGTTKTRAGTHLPIRGPGVQYGQSDAAKLIWDYLRTSLAPAPGGIISALAGRNAIGDPASPLDVAGGLVTPLGARDIYDAMRANDVPHGLAASILLFFGIRGSTYPDPTPKQIESARRTEAASRRAIRIDEARRARDK